MAELSSDLRKMIVVHWNQGKGVRLISKFQGISPSTVTKTLQRLQQTGSTSSRLRSGRPRVTTLHEDRLICRQSLAERKRSAKDIMELLPATSASVSTVRRRLRAAGLNSCSAVKKPLVTARNRALRLQWAAEHEADSQEQWSLVLFSDESKICRIGCNGQRRIRRRQHERLQPFAMQPTLVGGGGSLMMWGCMSARGVGPIVRLQGSINGERYCSMLTETVLPYMRQHLPAASVFQQDNAPCHTARIVKQLLQNEAVQVLQWPSQSPDLSPIENLWGILKLRVSKRRPATLEDLWRTVQEEWGSISPQLCSHLVESMPSRCRAVREARGYPSKY